jgi:glycosyltransferase involved in cell wall biosynthesis
VELAADRLSTSRRWRVVYPIFPPPVVDVVIPVHNEERDLERSVRRVHDHLAGFPFSFRITIADGASTDNTWEIASRMAAELSGVRLVHLNEKGRGRALAAAWLTSDAEVVAYMDADLSTNLRCLLPLVAPVVSGHSDLSIGSRLSHGPKRLLRLVLGVRFRDRCRGFMAMRAGVARRLVPLVRDRSRCFNTELLVRAEQSHMRIHELSVDTGSGPAVWKQPR